MSPRTDAPPRAAAVLLAAGRSTRMALEGGARKPFLELDGRSVLELAFDAFDACDAIGAIVVVGHREDLGRIERALAGRAKLRAVVPGGEERTDSVRLGVEAVGADAPVVAIHDAARPFVRPATIARCVAAAEASGAALVAVPCSDTVKESDGGARGLRTLDRSRLWLAQTPQAFRTEPYLELLRRAQREGFRPTDDAALHERYVGPVTLVEGERSNLKITTREDLAIAAALLRARRELGEEAAR